MGYFFFTIMYLNPKEHELHKGYYYCHFANETIVTKNGDAVSLRTGNKLPKWLDNKSGTMKGVIHHNGETIYTSISTLVAKTFIKIPEELLNKRIAVVKANHNKLDDSLENLRWGTYKDIQIDAFLKKREELKLRFNLPSYIDNIDFYEQEPIECLFKPGYYYIPFTKAAIVVNKNGDLFNLEKNEEHPYTITKKGYKKTQLGTDNFKVTWSVHRIVGLIFVKKPDEYKDIPFEDLEINHKDTNKTNNSYDNLEWCTTYDNMVHAWENDLVKTNKIVLAKNITTGEITRFFSISKCAEYFKINHGLLGEHLNSNSAGRVIKNDHVFMLESPEVIWPKLIATQTGYYDFTAQSTFVFINKFKGNVLLFSSLPEACSWLKLNINILKNNKSAYGIEKPTNGWIYVRLNEFLDNPIEKYLTLL